VSILKAHGLHSSNSLRSLPSNCLSVQKDYRSRGPPPGKPVPSPQETPHAPVQQPETSRVEQQTEEAPPGKPQVEAQTLGNPSEQPHQGKGDGRSHDGAEQLDADKEPEIAALVQETERRLADLSLKHRAQELYELLEMYRSLDNACSGVTTDRKLQEARRVIWNALHPAFITRLMAVLQQIEGNRQSEDLVADSVFVERLESKLSNIWRTDSGGQYLVLSRHLAVADMSGENRREEIRKFLGILKSPAWGLRSVLSRDVDIEVVCIRGVVDRALDALLGQEDV
jgi:hypothetical protein